MKSLDQQEQWSRLTDTYRRMTEEELGRVAADAFDLVPIAREALQTVVAERGLKLQPAVAPQPPKPSEPSTGNGFTVATEDSEDPDYKLVSVRTVHSESEARQLKGLLDANFIASCLGPENIVDVQDFKASFDKGVELKVHAFNSRRAFDALALYAPEKDQEEDPDEDAEYAVMCPKCHSQEVFLRDDGPQEAHAAGGNFKWQCDACGHQWEDEGIEEKL